MNQFVSQTPQNVSCYVSAPTSPSGCSLDNMQFYSAPSSPIQRIGNGSFGYGSEMEKTGYEVDSDSDGFEFEISRNVVIDSDFEVSQRYECHHPERKQELLVLNQQQERVDSFSKMAFADELFSNGKVLPLKPPPGRVGSRTGPSSVTTSPRSLSPVLRIPFARKNTWNDNFDPFTVALEKVKDEKRGRKSVHRRSQSLSPFRTITTTTTTKAAASLQPLTNENGPNPKIVHLVRPKGSDYARWVHRESMGHNLSPSPKGITTKKPKKGLSFGRSVKPQKVGQEGPTNPNSTTLSKPTMKKNENGEQSEEGTSKVKKMKGILMRYASFRKETNEGKLTNQIAAFWKPSYLNRLSFKFKGNGQKKKVCGEPKMAVIQYKPKPKLALCLGHGMESPRF